MSRKSRLLRILVVVLLIVVFIGYFAFSTLLFDPFEDSLELDASVLVDRRVDFFIARAQLEGEFDPFPHLRAIEVLDDDVAWQVWFNSPECETLSADIGYPELIGRIEQELSQLPLSIEPLDVFGGRDLIVAGKFKPGGIEQSEWAIYGSLSTTGKLGVEMLKFPGLIGLEDQGITVTPLDGYVTMSGGNISSPISVGRILDVGIVSNSAGMITRAIELESKQFEGSVYAGATYNDGILLGDRNDDANEFEIILNNRALMETMQVTGAWPDPNSQDFVPSLISKFFQIGTINQLVGILGIDEGVSLDLKASLSSELMSSLQTRTYNKRAISGEDLVDKYAVYAPQDVSIFVYFKCNMGDLLTQVFDSMEPATRGLVEERFQATGKYRDLNQLIEEIDSALLDHFVFMARENDYPEADDDPPHNDEPVPAFAIVAFLADGGKEKIDGLRATVGGMGASIGLQGSEPGTSGFYSRSVGGYSFNEYWSPHIDGTGVMAAGTTQDVVTITNSSLMYEHVRKTFTQGAPTRPRLSERSDFATLARHSENGANLAIWINPRSAMPMLKTAAQGWAEDGVTIDWAFERARVEDKVLRDEYRDRKKEALTPIERGDLDRVVNDQLDEIDQAIKREQIPKVLGGYERKLTYLNAIHGGLMMIAASPRDLDLTLRLMTPIEGN